MSDLDTLLDRERIGALRVRVFVICGLLLMIDGYDIAALGFAAPAIAADWRVPAASFGLALSASFVGVALGSICGGWLGDRAGRRVALIWMISIAGVGSLATAYCSNMTELVALRVFTGLGLGGTIPNAIALVSEYAPRARRAFLVVLVYSSAGVGGAVGGAVAGTLVRSTGWPGIFLVGGIGPLLLAVITWLALPESLRYLASRPEREAEARRIAAAIDPASGSRLVLRPIGGASSKVEPVVAFPALFEGWLKLGTPLLWLLFILTQGLVFFLSSWLPSTLKSAGLDLEIALRAVALFNVGGVLGGIATSWLTDRFRPERVLPFNYFVAALSLVALGESIASAGMTVALSFLVGAAVLGASFCLGALASGCYRDALRARGVGFGLGAGRIGSIASPLIGGWMLGAGTEPGAILASLGWPAALGVVVVLLVGRLRYARKPTVTA